jgi:hypothetical protein
MPCICKLQSFSILPQILIRSLIFLFLSGAEPLVAQDIAELVVFTATRRENVLISDVAIFPTHQASATVSYAKS